MSRAERESIITLAMALYPTGGAIGQQSRRHQAKGCEAAAQLLRTPAEAALAMRIVETTLAGTTSGSARDRARNPTESQAPLEVARRSAPEPGESAGCFIERDAALSTGPLLSSA